MQESSKIWLEIGHWWRRVLRKQWPEIYTSRRRFNTIQAAYEDERRLRLMAEQSRIALQKRIDTMHGEINNLGVGLSSMELGSQELLENLNTELVAARRRIMELEEHVATDPLTGLTSEDGFAIAFKATVGSLARTTRVGAEKRHLPRITLIYGDLDNFKAVNDELGHAGGDAVLKAVADLMRKHFGHRPGDIICRLHGDEFVIAMSQITQDEKPSPEELNFPERQAAAFCKAFENDLRLQKTQGRSRVTISLGIATAEIEATARPEAVMNKLLKQADTAMYDSKGKGRNTISVFGRIERPDTLK